MSESKNSWSWAMDEADLKNQVENYDSLKVTQSHRGITVLVISCILAFSLLLSFLDLYATPQVMMYGLLIYIPVLVYFYRGHQWAIILLIILWTYEKGYAIYESGGKEWFWALFWWFALMPHMLKALKVEQVRENKSKAIPVSEAEKKVCMRCGGLVEVDSKFCSQCGRSTLVSKNSLPSRNRIKQYCHECGEEAIVESNFCQKCGVKKI